MRDIIGRRGDTHKRQYGVSMNIGLCEYRSFSLRWRTASVNHQPGTCAAAWRWYNQSNRCVKVTAVKVGRNAAYVRAVCATCQTVPKVRVVV